MRHRFGTSVGLLAGLALVTGTQAAVNDAAAGGNPYNAIVARNVFDLHAVVIPQTKPPEIVKPPANVKLTGLTTLFGAKQAYFSILEAPAPGKPAAKLKYLTLIEGERKDGLELQKIDIKGQKVIIIKDGEPSELTLEKARPGPAAPGGGVPQPQQMAGRGPVPIPSYAAQPAAQVVPNPYSPVPGNGMNNNAVAPLGNIPRPIRGDQQMDPETQIILMEAERLRTQESVSKGDMPPIPFTPITAEVMGTAPAPGGDAQSPAQTPDRRIFGPPRR